jgi:hypothetical protein
MAALCHVTSSSVLRKFQANRFLCDRVSRILFRVAHYSFPIRSPSIHQKERIFCVNVGKRCSSLSPYRHACIESPFALGSVQIGTGYTLTGDVWFQLEGSVTGRKQLKINWKVKERSSELDFMELYGIVNRKFKHWSHLKLLKETHPCSAGS